MTPTYRRALAKFRAAGAAKAWPHDSKGRAQQPRPKWKGCK
jgi:hypothetical protein